MTDPQTPATALPNLSVRTAATELLGAIDKHDNANIHGWSVALRAALAAEPPAQPWYANMGLYADRVDYPILPVEPPALDVDALARALEANMTDFIEQPESFDTTALVVANIAAHYRAILAGEVPE